MTRAKQAGSPANRPPLDLPEGCDVEMVEVERLIPNPRNPRQHPKEQLAYYQASLRSHGQQQWVIARRANMMLIAGHGLLQAAKNEGWQRVVTLLVDCTQDEADRMMLAHNRMAQHAKDSKDMIAELLAEMNPEELQSVGYSAEDAVKLIKPMDEADIEVFQVDASPVNDRAWMSISCPLRLQARVFDKLKELMAEFGDDLEIEQGIKDQFR